MLCSNRYNIVCSVFYGGYSNPPIYCASCGKAKMHGKSGGTVNRGKVKTCSIVKHDIGGTQRGTLYRGTW